MPLPPTLLRLPEGPLLCPPVWGFPGGSVVKNLPEMEETWVQSLGLEDPLEKGMATHSMDRGTWQATVHGSQRVRQN